MLQNFNSYVDKNIFLSKCIYSTEPEIKSVLFVCLGNICRSPTAEALFRQKSSAVELNISCDSAGTADWHIGSPPYQPMQEAALVRGINMSKLRARQISIHDFTNFDLIIVMDEKNRANLNTCLLYTSDAADE